ncbi:conjugative transposon TraM protein [Mucilaginibacter sp. SG538B]|uniref:conjugative transposon protein TraM n=1 Tax=Mucilaginibacter sp. SG538B TaxID=2587021 RepID=UPI00159E65CD|nr:conjugative transposon protein TraM [Mucilaginibacter sp. SG538B]NVM66931.1 conjugative transposon TraM protein [Mucilaginibacter sp. SG538B]
MKIDFKQPKYVLPVIVLPFLVLFFYAWQTGFAKKEPAAKPATDLNANVGDVSSYVRKKDLADKLDAYRNTYKDADGPSAVNVIPKEQSGNAGFHNLYTKSERFKLDSVEKAMKAKYAGTEFPQHAQQDREMAAALNNYNSRQRVSKPAAPPKEIDPMDVFKQQMAYMDSMSKSNDPEYKAERKKMQLAEKTAREKVAVPILTVSKNGLLDTDFNSIRPESEDAFITAMIDEGLTGYAGSRLRLKLLEDIRVGDKQVAKGSLLYAQVSGFSEQRVALSINSVLSDGKILPVKLEVYDLDGLPGLYVPASAFRDFSKDLGGSSVQGVTLDGTSGSQFIMSSVSKMFQSTSSAIAELIRKNKARFKYNSYLYLIDPSEIQKNR